MKANCEIVKFPEYDNNCFSVRMQSKSGNMITPAHYHDCVEILYCTQGSFAVGIQDEIYSLQAGDMAVVLIDEVHNLHPTGDGDNRYLVIKFNPDMLCRFGNSEAETSFLSSFSTAAMLCDRVFTKEKLHSTEIPKLMQSMILESENKDFGYEVAIRANIVQLLLWIVRSWREECTTPDVLKKDIDIIPTLKKIFVFVEYHYMEPITMETVADALNMNYYAFSKLFSHQTGLKFPDYLNRVRLQKAKIFLASTSKSVADIWEKSGYLTTSYFIKKFKDENGMTPQQYRTLIFDSGYQDSSKNRMEPAKISV